jgi:hypothetical protein
MDCYDHNLSDHLYMVEPESQDASGFTFDWINVFTNARRYSALSLERMPYLVDLVSGTLALVGLTPAPRLKATAPLGAVVLQGLVPVPVARPQVPLGTLALQGLVPTPRARVALPLGALVLEGLVPAPLGRAQAPLGVLVYQAFPPTIVGKMTLDLVLGLLVFSGLAPQVQEVVVTNKKRILDALCARIVAAQFPLIRYDNVGCTVLEGTHQAPMSKVSNEVRSTFTRHPRVNRRHDFQERDVWSWDLILQFHREVSLELFERTLMGNPIALAEDPGSGLEAVRLALVNSNYEHPTEQQPSNGTKATYQLVAEVGPR